MRYEVTQQLTFKPGEKELLDHHSLLNLFNVLERQLGHLSDRLPYLDFSEFTGFCLNILLALSEDCIKKFIPEMEENCACLRDELLQALQEHPEEGDLIRGILETVAVGHARVEELKGNRFIWTAVEEEAFRENLFNFLKATEKAGENRFHFVFAPEKPSKEAYWVEFKVDESTHALRAPVVLHDSIRDLVGNARKYSAPGSIIQVELAQEGEGLHLTVRDQGIGIPEEEVGQIVDFGYRASNAMDRPTMGGGFGLTKAYHLCKECNGRFFIETELGLGSTIEMTLFPPD
jgi:signal transduction histidine kinase